MIPNFRYTIILSYLICGACEAPTIEFPSEVELRSEESEEGSDDEPSESDDEFGVEPPAELSVEWLDEDAVLPLESSAEIRLTSQVDLPLEVIVRERWDFGGQEQNTASLGSFALEPETTLDLQVGAAALANAGSEYSGMLKVSVDVYDDEATHVATIHSPLRYFHRSGSTILFYDEQILIAEHGSGLLAAELPAGALEDEEGNPIVITRVTRAGAGVVGERVELGNPNSVEDAP